MELEQETGKLIRLIKKRNPDALEKLMDIYIDPVYNLAKSILFNVASDEDVEECVQDVFLHAWDNIENYDPDRGSVKTWLLILCKYKALNIRKFLINRGKVIELDELLIASKENPEDEYVDRESKVEIVTVLNSFNNIDREIFLRRYILDQSIEDICSIMKLSRQAVDNRLWRGRRELRGKLSSAGRRSVNE